MRSIAVALLTASLSVAAPTQIRDTAYTGFAGVLFTARITITGPEMTTQDGRTIHRSEQTFTIANGEIALDLEPNEAATPAGTAYLVIYRPKVGQPWSERWVVPVSDTPVTVNQVRAPASYLAVLPDQITRGGARTGPLLGWNGAKWGPVDAPAGGGGARAVASVFGRTGAIMAQGGDYNFLQIGGTLSHVQIAQGGATTGQLLGWTGSQWSPVNAPVGGVSSIFGRSGAVMGQIGDYDFSQILGHVAHAQIAQEGASAGQLLGWSGAHWSAVNAPTIPVSSIFGRTGAVTTQTGDYSFDQIAGKLAHIQIAQESASLDQYLAWNGTQWAPSDAPVSPAQSIFGRTGTITPQS